MAKERPPRHVEIRNGEYPHDSPSSPRILPQALSRYALTLFAGYALGIVTCPTTVEIETISASDQINASVARFNAICSVVLANPDGIDADLEMVCCPLHATFNTFEAERDGKSCGCTLDGDDWTNCTASSEDGLRSEISVLGSGKSIVVDGIRVIDFSPEAINAGAVVNSIHRQAEAALTEAGMEIGPDDFPPEPQELTEEDKMRVILTHGHISDNPF